MNELQQFCILAKTQKSRACAALIQQVGHVLNGAGLSLIFL